MHIHLHNRSLRFLMVLPKVSQISHHQSWVMNQNNTHTPTRTITKTWSLAAKNHHSPSAVLSNHLLDGRQCWSCKLDILWLWLGFSHVFSRKMMARYNFLRLKLTRSISWERCPRRLVLINLLIPVSLFYSFFDYFPTNFNFIRSHIDSHEAQRASVWFWSGNS